MVSGLVNHLPKNRFYKCFCLFKESERGMLKAIKHSTRSNNAKARKALLNDYYTLQFYGARGFAMSAHQFDPDIAKLVGCNAAVIYQNLFYWAEKNAANDRHFCDGRWWTYNSIKAFAELFPYLTGKQIRTALDKLESSGLIVSGCYNKTNYDRTKWYSPTCLNGQSHLPKKANEVAQKGKPIPDINTNNKPDIIIEGYPLWMPIDAWQGWVEMRKQRKRPLTDRAKTRAINKLDAIRAKGHDIAELLDRSTINGWLDIYEPKENHRAGNSAKPTEPTNPMVRAVIASQAKRAADRQRFADDWP